MRKILLGRYILLLVIFMYILYLEYSNYVTTGQLFLLPPSVFFTFVGACLNFLAISMNKWQMPVYDRDKKLGVLCGEHHKAFRDVSKVKLFWLCDIFPVKIRKRGIFFSVGDILIVLGVFMLFV